MLDKIKAKIKEITSDGIVDGILIVCALFQWWDGRFDITVMLLILLELRYMNLEDDKDE